MGTRSIVAVALALLAPACTSDGTAPPGPKLTASVASYDLAVGAPGRFLVGLGTLGEQGQLYVVGGSVRMTTPVGGGDPQSATSAFQVLPKHLVPAPRDTAPNTENLTLDSEDAPKVAVDSRAATEGIPDPELHRSTVAEAIAAGDPALLVISTPVYCVSRFCGPITDMVQELAAEYADRAEFIHIEVWRDFENQVVNEGAAEWILRADELQEPWVFLVGGDGKVVARWDNVATRREIEPYLEELPREDA